MRRETVAPRDGWQAIVESQGFPFHTLDGQTYWDESACYLFTAEEIDEIEAAGNELHDRCLDAVDYVLNERLLDRFDIPRPYWDWIERSWREESPALYGRFDLSYNGADPPKMLEYNADTPTSLVEAAVVQWFWLQDVWGSDPDADQFNLIHEQLIETWTQMRDWGAIGEPLHFASPGMDIEDDSNVVYLRDTAEQAGLETRWIALEDIGWNEGAGAFLDLDERPIRSMFKLYPWEWMVREEFGPMLLEQPDLRWFEPPWKMILSNKAILPVLWELFPGHPNLLPATFDPKSFALGDAYLSKPILAREGANVVVVDRGRILASTDGPYDDGLRVYQQFHPLPSFGGHRPVLGCWIVGGHAVGLGIRESDELITRNTSRFVPHLFR